MSQKVVILGGGPAAVEAALTASLYSEDVTMVAANGVGDWGKHGVSNIILEQITRGTGKRTQQPVTLDWSQELFFVKQQLAKWSVDMCRILHEKGINMVSGRGQFLTQNTILVTDSENMKRTELSYDKAFIAVGAAPVFPSGLEPDGRQVFSPHTITQLEQLPKSILVIGDGPISLEYVNIFHAYGVNVTWLVPEQGPNYMLDTGLNNFLTEQLKKKGIQIIPGPFVSHILRHGQYVEVIRQNGCSYTAEMAFLSIGFKSNLDAVGIEKLGIAVDSRGVPELDPFGQTSVKDIYVIGDARYAHSVSLSTKQARYAVKHSFGEDISPKQFKSTPVTFNLTPQIAIVGKTQKGESIRSMTLPTDFRHFKSYMTGQDQGLIRILWDDQDKARIVGAVVIGGAAAEIITPIAFAIHASKSIHDLADFFTPHPSMSELATLICREIEHRMNQ